MARDFERVNVWAMEARTMIGERVKLALSSRETMLLLLTVTGILLWTLPSPDVQKEMNRIYARSLASGIVEQHNATASRDVHAISELSSGERKKAATAFVAKSAAQNRALIMRIYLGAVTHVVAACCWFAAVMCLLVHGPSDVPESTRHAVGAV
jgi:hypothetical protein